MRNRSSPKRTCRHERADPHAGHCDCHHLDTLIDDYLATAAWYHDTRNAWPTKANDWLAELDAIDARLVATAAGVPVDVPALRGGHWSQAERHQAVAAIAAKVDVEIGRALLAAFTADAITR